MTSTGTATTTLPTADGRTLAVDVLGAADAPVLLLCHPAPGSRRIDPDPAATAAAGLRLVTVDRPGYGGSTVATTPRTIPELADDLAAVLDGLGVTDASVAGWSAGGRVAMALAARHPDRVRAVGLLATPAPDDELPWYGHAERAMIDSLRGLEPGPAAEAIVDMFAQFGAADAGPSALGSGPDDEVLLRRPAIREQVERMLAEGLRPGLAGLAADLVSYTLLPWGFDPRAVGAPVRCWYGATDQLVPVAHGQWWAAQAADARVESVSGVGHLVPYAMWSELLGWARN
jgi:pimeloyl-ACP methyl ester carboxylesterase